MVELNKIINRSLELLGKMTSLLLIAVPVIGQVMLIGWFIFTKDKRVHNMNGHHLLGLLFMQVVAQTLLIKGMML